MKDQRFVENDINTNAITTRLDKSENNNHNDDENRNLDENDDSFSVHGIIKICTSFQRSEGTI